MRLVTDRLLVEPASYAWMVMDEATPGSTVRKRPNQSAQDRSRRLSGSKPREQECTMPENVVMQPVEDRLIISRKSIAAARSRAEQPSDGGSTGVSDTND
ncbi:hypothetical protein STRIP9103_03431 [Streptomyces ipomoeae 91-03]|uniref:Uncharacterized protein n=1 Tax=Streptomyces ipomoeae 91-03 TaxID=698759 RepID=L1KYQ2_9ACTN|nr:hypothetical protein STRIP9103_03431 [Streptomyces ipomoeae 91-03]